MSVYRFDPQRDLTLAEITQILREIYSNLPQRQKDENEASMPTFFAHVAQVVDDPTP